MPPPEGPLRTRLEPALRIARAIIGKTGVLAAVTAASALWLWSLIFYPFSTWSGLGSIAIALVVLLLLLGPSMILALFWVGLRALIRLPERLMERADESQATAGVLARATVDRSTYSSTGLAPFVRNIARLRNSLLESKVLIVQIGAVARLINPFFVFALLGSLVISPILIAIALVMVLAAIL